MSTRSTTHFVGHGGKLLANIYRHSDGYPEGAGTDIYRFFEEVEKQTEDTRFNDGHYLAAKYVVFLAGMFAKKYEFEGREMVEKAADPLDFISVGVMLNEDMGGLEYVYTINCEEHDSQGWPLVTCIELGWPDDGTPDKQVEIPRP